MNQFFYLSLPFLFAILFSLVPNRPWFSIVDKNLIVPLSLFFLFFLFLTLKFQKTWTKSLSTFETFLNENRLPLLFLFFLLTLSYPLRNLSWGDGIILLETNLLETQLFGSQIAMDEILETISHSFVFRILSFFDFSSDNRYSYQLISYISGSVFLSFVGWKLSGIEKKTSDLLAGLVILGSSGFLIFFGYAENYSILSLFILIFIYLVRSWILSNKSDLYILLGATLLVTLGIYLHLVSGFLVFALFYLWWEFSPKEKKWKQLLLCASLGGFLLAIGFGYLLFLHDPTLDRKSSHLLHPPLYPWKRLISINHFAEILSVMWYNSKVPVLILGFLFLFHKNDHRIFFKKRENRFVLSVAVSFLLNGFFINPMLGFPADWDMIGFYWIPLSYLGYLILIEYPQFKILFVGLIFFSLIIQVFQARELNRLNPQKEKEVRLVQDLVYKYVHENQKEIQTYSKTNRKFYAKTDFFFYKATHLTERMCDFPEKKAIINDLRNLHTEFRNGAQSGKLEDQNWIKDFLKTATVTNTEYIKSLTKYNLCHLEL